MEDATGGGIGRMPVRTVSAFPFGRLVGSDVGEGNPRFERTVRPPRRAGFRVGSLPAEVRDPTRNLAAELVVR